VGTRRAHTLLVTGASVAKGEQMHPRAPAVGSGTGIPTMFPNRWVQCLAGGTSGASTSLLWVSTGATSETSLKELGLFSMTETPGPWKTRAQEAEWQLLSMGRSSAGPAMLENCLPWLKLFEE